MICLLESIVKNFLGGNAIFFECKTTHYSKSIITFSKKNLQPGCLV